MQEVVPDLSTDPGPLPAPTPPELDPSTNSEPAEPATKKRKVPRLAASSDSGGAAKTGSPTVSAGAAASSGRRPSTGEMLPLPLVTLISKHLLLSCLVLSSCCLISCCCFSGSLCCAFAADERLAGSLAATSEAVMSRDHKDDLLAKIWHLQNQVGACSGICW